MIGAGAIRGRAIFASGNKLDRNLERKTDHIVLIGTECGPVPTPPPANGQGGRPLMLPDTFTILVVGE